MILSIDFRKILPLLPFIIPVLCIVVSKSHYFDEDPVSFSMAITFDLLVTTPVLYFLAIKSREIPNTTVVPVFILGIVIASIILPTEHQFYLSHVKTWFLPFLELAIVTYVILTIRKAYRAIKQHRDEELDFFSAAKEATQKILPKKLVIPFATELSVFYYGLILWKKRTFKTDEFTYHKETGITSLLVVFIFLILIETFAVHLLLQRWSDLAAWILSGISIYTCFQVLGILKSISKRPISVKSDSLDLKWGIMNETKIDLSNIKEIQQIKGEKEKKEGRVFLSPFYSSEGCNIQVVLKEAGVLTGFYGIKKPFEEIFFYVDNPDILNDLLEKKLN